jgi:hypothetical protein
LLPVTDSFPPFAFPSADFKTSRMRPWFHAQVSRDELKRRSPGSQSGVSSVRILHILAKVELLQLINATVNIFRQLTGVDVRS